MAERLERKVHLLEAVSAEPEPARLPDLDWSAALERIAEAAAAGRAHLEARDGMLLLARPLAGDVPALALYDVRRDRLPPLERDGAIAALRLADDEGLAQPVHAALLDGNVVGLLYDHQGPRPNRLADYLAAVAGLEVRLRALPRPDPLAVLDRLESLTQIAVRLRADALAALAEADPYWAALRDAHEGSAGTVSLRLRFSGAAAVDAAPRWQRRLGALLREHGAAVAAAAVRGRDPRTGRVIPLDLRGDRLVSAQRVERAGPRQRVPDDHAAVAAILRARDELADEVAEALRG